MASQHGSGLCSSAVSADDLQYLVQLLGKYSTLQQIAKQKADYQSQMRLLNKNTNKNKKKISNILLGTRRATNTDLNTKRFSALTGFSTVLQIQKRNRLCGKGNQALLFLNLPTTPQSSQCSCLKKPRVPKSMSEFSHVFFSWYSMPQSS